MLTSTRHGALTIVQETRSNDWVVRELKKLDDRLFLEKQLTYQNEEVWCVVCDIGLGHPPITILEWRDEQTGAPIPELSSGLVYRVSRMDRDGEALSARVMRANEKKIEEQRKESIARYRELALDVVPYMSNLRSGVLHRSQGLRRARDRQRNMGRRV